jgi:hypothetical protein
VRRVSSSVFGRAAFFAARLALAALVFARAAPAADGKGAGEPVRFHVSYVADDGCPTEADFRHGVETRALRAEATDAAHANVGLVVTLRRDGERTTGVLVVTLPDGTRSERKVSDTSCEAAAASLAVVSALGLDALLPEPAPPPEAPAVPPAPPAPPVAPREPPKSAPGPVEPTPPVDARLPKWGIDVRVRAHALWESAVAPRLPLGVLAGGDVASRGQGVFAPSAGLSALFTPNGRATTAAGSASFRLLAVRFIGCPFRFGKARGASFRPCLELDAGALRGTPDEAVRNRTRRTMPWLAAGLGVHGELPVGAGLALEAGAAGRTLFRHDVFVLRPGLPIHDVPALSVGVSAGLSYAF